MTAVRVRTRSRPDGAAMMAGIVLTIAALVTAVVLLTLAALRQPARPSPPPAAAAAVVVPAPPRPRPPAPLISAGAAAPGAAANANAIKVIPITWDTSSEEFCVTVLLGHDTVQAAMDTGSAKFVVATTACGTCSGVAYDPESSSTAMTLLDPRKVAASGVTALPSSTATPQQLEEFAQVLCSSTQNYGSQTDVIQAYQDVVSFPRRIVQKTTLCSTAASGIDAALEATVSSPGPPLVITDFPIEGIVRNTGTSSVNVMGLSAVRAQTTIVVDGRTEYLMPSCQVTPVQAFESPVIQAVAAYCSANGLPIVWSAFFGDTTGFIVFAAVELACINVTYANMVPVLQSAPTALVRAPYRYYVVGVTSMAVGPLDGPWTPVIGAPKQLLVDTGTSQFLLPGPSAPATVASLNALPVGQVLVVTLDGGAADDTTLVYHPDPRTVFGVMPDALAQQFSSSMDVGILGNLAMRNRYIEFDITHARVGFA